jgi:hypothetical protein
VETKFFIQSLGLSFFCFIKIHNFPFLVESLSLCMHNNLLAFFVFWSWHIKVLSVLNINKSINFVLENLEPLWVSAPDLHFVSSTRALNIPRLIIVFRSNGQRVLMEVPLLSVSTIGGLDNHISIVNQIKISSWW